jgi:hypothetical protein
MNSSGLHIISHPSFLALLTQWSGGERFGSSTSTLSPHPRVHTPTRSNTVRNFPTDNCPQPKEAQPLSQLDIRIIRHLDTSALWFDGAEVALNESPFPHRILPPPPPRRWEKSRCQLVEANVLEPLIKALGAPAAAVRVAACLCCLSLSRSVRHLCVSLVDANLAAPLLRLLADPDPHVQVPPPPCALHARRAGGWGDRPTRVDTRVHRHQRGFSRVWYQVTSAEGGERTEDTKQHPTRSDQLAHQALAQQPPPPSPEQRHQTSAPDCQPHTLRERSRHPLLHTLALHPHAAHGVLPPRVCLPPWQAAAAAPLCNLALHFSPVQEQIVAAGGGAHLAALARPGGDASVRLNAVW